MSKIKDVITQMRNRNNNQNEPDMLADYRIYERRKYSGETAYNAVREYFRVHRKVNRDWFIENQTICSTEELRFIIGRLYREKKIIVRVDGTIIYVADLTANQINELK